MTLRYLSHPLRSAQVGILLIAALTALPTLAQPQSKGQQACLKGLASAANRVAKTQTKENSSCLRLVAKGTDGAELPGGSASACIDADPKGKVGKAQAKTLAVEAKSCTPAPDFGYQPAADINDAARAASTSLFGDLFGPDYGTAAATCETDKAACGCQAGVLKATSASFAAKLKLYLACAKSELGDEAAAIDALDRCLNDGATPASVAADLKGKLAKQDAKLEATVVNACLEPSLNTDTLFPGQCVGRTGESDFADCIDDRIECRLCELLERSQGLGVDCDFFDDAVANASCVDFPGSAFFSVAAGNYVGAASDTLALLANEQYPTAALDYFELTTSMGEIVLRNTGNGKYVRIDAGDSVAYADADEAAATPWVVFVSDQDLIIMRNGPVGPTVDALRYDSGSGNLKLINAPIVDVLGDPACSFRLED